MEEKIYKMYMGRPKPGWYALTKEEQEAVFEKINASLEKVGGKRVVVADSSWSNEQWAFFGVEEYPNIDAVKTHAENLGAMNWPYEFAETVSLIGTDKT